MTGLVMRFIMHQTEGGFPLSQEGWGRLPWREAYLLARMAQEYGLARAERR